MQDVFCSPRNTRTVRYGKPLEFSCLSCICYEEEVMAQTLIFAERSPAQDVH